MVASSVMMQVNAQSTLTIANNGYVTGTSFQIGSTNLNSGGADGTTGISWDMSANSQSGTSTISMLAPGIYHSRQQFSHE